MFSFNKKLTKKVKVGNLYIGGDSLISVQTMTKTKTADAKATIMQVQSCYQAGADIVRITVNDDAAAEAMKTICSECKGIPIVADIHFNHIYAIKAIEAGVAKVRINPGNIGSNDRVRQVLNKAKDYGIAIRIGVNSGSLEKEILAKYGHPTAEALYESAIKHAEIANSFDFDDIVISVKSTNVPLMIQAYRLLSEKTDYPLHLGVTEAGTYKMGTLKSAIGIGTLLAEGIGDTIRVSLTDEPEKEVEIGKDLLKILDIRKGNVELISCPTCGRLEVDLFKIANAVETAVKDVQKSLKVAVMGCPVNGIGEAKESNLGVACGKGYAILFKDGLQIKRIQESEIISELLKEIDNY
jgi:(E)-4-hydroxy-3-methylbut-2-enyl-diphosphate synthase